MSEIATTARIRELFTDGGFWNSDVFDEWLEQHDAEVAKAAEARIIKLLDEMLAENWDWAEDCTCDGCIRINKMFALIKGEK